MHSFGNLKKFCTMVHGQKNIKITYNILIPDSVYQFFNWNTRTDIHRRTRSPLFPVYHIVKNVIWLTLILLMWRIWWAPNSARKWQMGFNSAFEGLRHIVSYITLLTCKERRSYYTPSWRLVQFSVFQYLAPVGGCMETLAWLIKRNYTNEMLQQKKVSGLKFAWHSIRQGVLRHSDRSPSFKGDVPETNLLHFGGNACTVYCYRMIN